MDGAQKKELKRRLLWVIANELDRWAHREPGLVHYEVRFNEGDKSAVVFAKDYRQGGLDAFEVTVKEVR